MFELNILLRFQYTANLVGLLTENNLVAALCSSNGSLKTRNTATNYHHLLALTCRNYLHSLYLTADKRINGTTASERDRTLCHTGIATQTLHYAVFFASHYLLRMEWISKQLSPHINYICLALGYDALHLFRIAKSTDSSNRLLNVLLYLGSKPYVHTVLVKHRRCGVEESKLIRTCRNMDKVNILFYRLCNLDTILYAIATIKKLTTTKANLNREIWSYGITY